MTIPSGFGNKLAQLTKEKGWSQTELAHMMKTSVSVISRYEREKMTPSSAAATRLASLLGTTAGYLLGDGAAGEAFLKDPEVISRFQAISSFGKDEQEKIYFTLDAMIHEITNRQRYALK